jgi:N-acetylmuramoyl-L-alanine amidase
MSSKTRDIATLVFVLAGLIFAAASLAEAPKSTLFEEAKKKKDWRGPDFLLVYPEPASPSGRPGKKIDTPKIRFAGVTDPGARVSINGKQVGIFPNGAFAGLLDLKEGDNEFTFVASDARGSVERKVKVTRTPAPTTLPASPLRFDSADFMAPKEHLVLLPGDILRVKCKASAGQDVLFRIGESKQLYQMCELPPDEADGLGGIYVGACVIQAEDRFQNQPVEFVLRSKGRLKIATKAMATGRVSVDDPRTVRMIRVEDVYTPLYCSPEGGARFGNAPQGVRLRAVGREGDRIKVALSSSLFAWVKRKEIAPFPDGTPPPRSLISSISTVVTEAGTTVTIPLSERLPFQISERLDPPGYELFIYGARSDTSWVTNRHDDRVVKQLKWDQPEDGVYRLWIGTQGSAHWGYDVYYVNNTLHVSLKAQPKLAPLPDSPVKGLTIVLDPGHGGSERGALGSTGLYEKDVNLYVAKALRERLERSGARVVLTRSDDRVVALSDRVATACKAHGDLLLSLHNNSIDWSTDPLRPRGTSTYYYSPQAIDLSRALYRRLLALSPPPQAFGNVELDFFVIREAHQMPAALVEGLFMSHPGDEALLMDETFLEHFVDAIYDGVVDYLKPFQR